MILRAIVEKLDRDGAKVDVTLPQTVSLFPFGS
jgi:hypothetical protein